ncbi:hypothetical protein QBC34DRAFT_464378 [Podospora aff. communis PSN243]|uniref:Uncharacterized protein n=1 Tax=Podospora aff. communis PSN243 TaxID=3040156 RepID=A0AAV9GKN6_9PEZI|nr:hypothetical protein QBC34DRAFT_464378 [Podospora aff. communis PSN243]
MRCPQLLPLASAWLALFQAGHAHPTAEHELGPRQEAQADNPPTESGFQVLDPIPRYIWDPSVPQSFNGDADADDVPLANLSLATHEQLLWWSAPSLDPTLPPNTPNTGGKPHHTTLVSMVTWASQDQRIVDMSKFAWSLRDVNCSTNNTYIQFHHAKNFYAAQEEWEWLNYNALNSFILVGDQHACGRDWSPQPLVVSRLRYHPKNLTVTMRAEKSSWRKVADMYTLDFGMTQSSRMPVNARDLAARAWFDWDVSFDPTFTLSLASKWPRTFLNKTFGPKNEANINVICADCGVTGGLTFAGHIEGSLLGGIDHLVVSATPDDLSANLALEANFKGKYSFKNTEWARGEVELWVIPLPYGFVIPKVLTFGPTAKLMGGWEIDSVSGHATVTAGMSARIPDDSIAKVDVIAKDVEVSGWKPVFEVQPPKLESAGISAKGSLYGKLAVALSLEVMDEAGINTDVYLKLPLTIEAEAGYQEGGFCPGSSSPWGISLESELGCVVGLEAWKELKGDKDILFNVVFYQDLDIVDLPPLCLSLDSIEGVCPAIKDSLDWYENEVEASFKDDVAEDPEEGDEDDDDDDKKKKPPTKGYYSMWCDPSGTIDPEKPEDKKKSTYRIWLKGYPGPSALIKIPGVPIMKPMFDACKAENAEECVPNKWDIEARRSAGGSEPDVGVTFDNPDNNANSEHVYEGQWIREYYDYLYKTYYNPNADDKPPEYGEGVPDEQCKKLAEDFQIKGRGKRPHDSLMSSLGRATGPSPDPEKTMTLFPLLENGLKHRPDAGFNPKDEEEHGKEHKYPGGYYKAACGLGRLVVVCKYLKHQYTLDAMRLSVSRVDAALRELDATPPKNKPANMNVGYRDAHQVWFQHMWTEGIKKMKDYIVHGADYLAASYRDDDFEDLPEDTQKMVKAILNSNTQKQLLDDFCPSETFTWPASAV